ncbi:response regulator [Endozoicomonas lisbonensis]|uniref:response regulator n=1 Tax=Endozoicomonas lisbonensis TaxID=3120522 RepID=UPI0033922A22
MEDYQSILTGKQILVAEDNSANQMVMKKLLKKVGIEAEFANNGQIALENYQQNHERWQLVLMDCEMPVLDGYDATAAIRQFEEEAGLDRKLIIGLSAHAINELKKKALERGMDDYLTKPIDRDLLYKTLVDYLS